MQRGDEVIGALDGSGAIAVQRQLGGIVDVLHAANEHLTQVVERPRRLARQQGDRQRHPFVRLQGLHTSCVERPGLFGEVTHLDRWYPGQRNGADRLRRQPALTGHQIAQVRQRRVASIRLEVVPGRAEGGQVGDEQRVDACQVVLAQCFEHVLVQRSVEGGAHAARGPIQRVERWQFETLADQLFDRDVDQVLEFVFGGGGFGERHDHRVATGSTIGLHLQVLADGGQVALLGARMVVGVRDQRGRRKSGNPGDMIDDRG